MTQRLNRRIMQADRRKEHSPVRVVHLVAEPDGTSGLRHRSTLTFALALHLNAVAGSVAALVAGIALAVIMPSPPVAVVYAMLILAGVGTHGTAALLIAVVANHYPERLRDTALG